MSEQGDMLKNKLFEKYTLAKNTVYPVWKRIGSDPQMFQGSVLADDETPSKYGATDDDELVVFVEEPVKVDSIIPCHCSSTKSSFQTSFTPFREHSTPSVVVKPSKEGSEKTESDMDYADRMMASGVYRAPLIEVANHPCLKQLFLNKLKNSDNKLYNVRRQECVL